MHYVALGRSIHRDIAPEVTTAVGCEGSHCWRATTTATLCLRFCGKPIKHKQESERAQEYQRNHKLSDCVTVFVKNVNHQNFSFPREGY